MTRAGLIAAVFAGALAAACAAPGQDLAESGAVRLEIEDRPGACIENVSVRRAGDEVTVKGRVKPCRVYAGDWNVTHVHIDVMDPAGSAIARLEAPCGCPQVRRGRARFAAFEVTRRMFLPRGAVVRLWPVRGQMEADPPRGAPAPAP